MTHPDVLIVGAGPAGSIAALTLARAGVRVHVVDRAAFPRAKLCGDTLNPGSLAILDRLGPGEAVRRRALAVTGMDVTGPGGAMVSGGYPEGVVGAAIVRRDLDALLLETARRAGAQVETGTLVNGLCRSGSDGRVTGVRATVGGRTVDLDARVVIAADGRASRLAAAAGLARFARYPRRWAFGAYFTDVAGVSTRGEMHIRRGGYIGVAPLPDHVTNVCVVVSDPGKGGWRRPRHPNETVSAAVIADPLLKDRFANARQVTDVVALGPLGVDAAAAGCPGLLLAGDSAGFVDPMTGDGLRFAFRGGELAAEAAMRELALGTPAYRYLWAVRHREFRSKWRLNRGLRAFVDSPSAVQWAARLSKWWTLPVEVLVRRAGDVNLVSGSV